MTGMMDHCKILDNMTLACYSGWPIAQTECDFNWTTWPTIKVAAVQILRSLRFLRKRRHNFSTAFTKSHQKKNNFPSPVKWCQSHPLAPFKCPDSLRAPNAPPKNVAANQNDEVPWLYYTKAFWFWRREFNCFPVELASMKSMDTQLDLLDETLSLSIRSIERSQFSSLWALQTTIKPLIELNVSTKISFPAPCHWFQPLGDASPCKIDSL